MVGLEERAEELEIAFGEVRQPAYGEDIVSVARPISSPRTKIANGRENL